MLREFRLVSFGVLERVFQGHQGALALLQTCAMPFGLGLGHLGLLGRDRLSLLVHPRVGRLQRLFKVLFLALMMPVRAEYRLVTKVDIEPPVVDHALEAEFLHLVACAVHPWPLACLESLLDLWGAPVHQGLVRGRFNDGEVPGIIFTALFPRAALDSSAIVQGVYQGGLKASETRLLVVVAHTQQAQAPLVECPC